MTRLKLAVTMTVAALMALAPLAMANTAATPYAKLTPDAQRTHGTVCVTHEEPPVPIHVCVI